MTSKEAYEVHLGRKLEPAYWDILNAKPGRLDAFLRHTIKGGVESGFYPLIFGDGYGDFIKCRKRYRVVKGSRASKKTVTVARDFILKLMSMPDTNLLVVRKVHRTHKDSTFAELKKAIKFLRVERFWNWTTSPMEMTYLPTGQKILFRGMDDPLKITGISVDTGKLTFVWLEEAYEFDTEEEFDFIDESIRGILPPHLYYQFTITLNPWNKYHWIKSRFFDPIYGENEDKYEENRDIMAITTNFLINEFIDDDFRNKMEILRERNPARYKVAGLGAWGVSSGIVYENWHTEDFNIREMKNNKMFKHFRGLDFGFTNDPTGFVAGCVDQKNMIIYIYEEFFKKGMTNSMIADMLRLLCYDKDRIIADHAEPKSIEQLQGLRIKKLIGARKGNDSINWGIQRIQDFTVVVHSSCKNFITEISNYAWDPDKPDEPIDKFNHLMDAWRYGMEEVLYAPIGVYVPIGVRR